MVLIRVFFPEFPSVNHKHQVQLVPCLGQAGCRGASRIICLASNFNSNLRSQNVCVCLCVWMAKKILSILGKLQPCGRTSDWINWISTKVQSFLAVACCQAGQTRQEWSKDTNFFAACRAAWNCPPFRSCNPLNLVWTAKKWFKWWNDGWWVMGDKLLWCGAKPCNAGWNVKSSITLTCLGTWFWHSNANQVDTGWNTWLSLLGFQLIGIQVSTSWTLWAAPSWKQGLQDQAVRLVAAWSLTLSRSGMANSSQEYGKNHLILNLKSQIKAVSLSMSVSL